MRTGTHNGNTVFAVNFVWVGNIMAWMCVCVVEFIVVVVGGGGGVCVCVSVCVESDD